MSNLNVPSFGVITTPEDLFNLIANEAMPNGHLSIRGVARMADVQHTSIVRDGAWSNEKLAQALVPQGFQAGALVESGFPPVAVILVLEYFAYESKAKAPGAKALMRAFGAFGLKEVLSKLSSRGTTATEPSVKVLPQRDVIDYVQAAQVLPSLQVNSHLKALLEDALTDELELMRNQKLLGDGCKRQYTIAKVRAKELGYPIDKVKGGSGLGRYVARHMEAAFVERIGKYDVRHYEVNERLDEVIHSYFR
jgi:hypothetical protein